MSVTLQVLVAVAVVIACVLSRAARWIVGGALTLLLVVIVVVILVIVQDFRQKAEARQRIGHAEVQLDGLQLVPGSRVYMLGGFVRNLSSRFTLTGVTFELIAEDCIAGQCTEQGRGHAEVIRRVRPGETIGFETEAPWMPLLPDARGDRRLSYHIRNTWAVP